MNQRDSRRPNLTRRLAASLLLLSSMTLAAGAAPEGAAPGRVKPEVKSYPAGAAAKKSQTAAAPAGPSDTGNTDKMPNPGLWGSSGLLTVPTAEILPSHNFYGALSYFPLNSGLSLAGTVSILDDLEAGLVFGVPPANGTV